MVLLVYLAVMKKMDEFIVDYIFLVFFRTQKHHHQYHFGVFQKVIFTNSIILNENLIVYFQIKLSFFCIFNTVKATFSSLKNSNDFLWNYQFVHSEILLSMPIYFLVLYELETITIINLNSILIFL